eukprot:scaffold42141_cov30-Tisochrysis_lutea.AAC.1
MARVPAASASMHSEALRRASTSTAADAHVESHARRSEASVAVEAEYSAATREVMAIAWASRRATAASAGGGAVVTSSPKTQHPGHPGLPFFLQALPPQQLLLPRPG